MKEVYTESTPIFLPKWDFDPNKRVLELLK